MQVCSELVFMGINWKIKILTSSLVGSWFDDVMKSEGYEAFGSLSKEVGSWWVCIRMIYLVPNLCHPLFCLLPSYHQTSSFVLPHTFCREAQKWQCKWPCELWNHQLKLTLLPLIISLRCFRDESVKAMQLLSDSPHYVYLIINMVDLV